MTIRISVKQLPFPKYIRGKLNSVSYTLPGHLFIDQWIVPSGTTVKLVAGPDFGYVTLPPDCKDKRGFVIPQRIFRY